MGDRRRTEDGGRFGQVESEQNDGINDSISCPFRHGRDDVDGGGGGGAHRDDSNYEYVIWIGADDDSDATLEPLSPFHYPPSVLLCFTTTFFAGGRRGAKTGTLHANSGLRINEDGQRRR